jgi:uncharacterized damage-inducible protein DinB
VSAVAGVGSLYEGWERINSRVLDRLAGVSADELQLVGADDWPVWALIAHMAGARVYWLCGVFGEPGAEATPFTDPFGEGWDDHLEVPRGAAELRFAVASSWRIVESCLAGWTPASLSQTFERQREGQTQLFTRASVLTRLATHDAFHCGEVSLILGMNGRQSLDPWAAPG